MDSKLKSIKNYIIYFLICIELKFFENRNKNQTFRLV